MSKKSQLKIYNSLNTENLMFLNNHLRKYVDNTKIRDLYPGQILAQHNFKEPYPSVTNAILFRLAFMDLLIRGVYPRINGFTKFTLFINSLIEGSPVTTALSKAIKLTYDPKPEAPNETPLPLPKEIILREIEKIVQKFLEKYDKAEICSIYIKAYSMTFKNKDEVEPLSVEESNMQLIDVLVRYQSIKNLTDTPSMSMKPKKRKVVSYITRKRKPKQLDPPSTSESAEDDSKRKKKKERGPSAFMVGDIETLPYHVDTDGPKTHVAYAAGYMVVNPIRIPDKADVNRLPYKGDVNRFYSEDYSLIYDMRIFWIGALGC